MCLLVVVSRLDPTAPLVIGANRDERLDRPATAMTVLRDSGPRIIGGRDEQAGGTWLAVNEHGVVAGLTNRPSPEGRDPAKRSRGELPLALAQHLDAASAVKSFVAQIQSADYNPAWILVGDRTSLYALDITGDGSGGGRPVVEQLEPGIHILENNPLHAGSAKATHIRARLGEAEVLSGETLVEQMRSVLVDHSTPEPGTRDAPVSDDRVDPDVVRPVETLAACVHTDAYGTRSSTIVTVPAAPAEPPSVLVADGHPCTSPYVDVTHLMVS